MTRLMPNSLKFEDLLNAYWLDERDAAFFRLVNRYWDRVSPAKQEKALALIQVGKESGRTLMEAAMKVPNPLLSLVEKDDSWSGARLVVPFGERGVRR